MEIRAEWRYLISLLRQPIKHLWQSEHLTFLFLQNRKILKKTDLARTNLGENPLYMHSYCKEFDLLFHEIQILFPQLPKYYDFNRDWR